MAFRCLHFLQIEHIFQIVFSLWKHIHQIFILDSKITENCIYSSINIIHKGWCTLKRAIGRWWVWWISHFSLENDWILRKSSPNTGCSSWLHLHFLITNDMVFVLQWIKLSSTTECTSRHTILPANSYLLRFNSSMLLLYFLYRARTVFEATNSDIQLFRNQCHRCYL